MAKKKSFLRSLTSTAALTGGLGFYLYRENYTFGLTHYILESPKYREGLDGFKIAQIADLNLPQERISLTRLIRSLKKAQPDMIALTGNMISGREPYDVDQVKSFSRALADIAPAFAVYGSHEASSSYGRSLERVMTDSGVQFLNDQAHSLYREGCPLTVMGLMEKANRRFLKKDVLGQIHLTKAQEDAPKVLLAHHPEAFLRYHDDMTKSPDLVLSGHAEGGQVRLPVLGGLYAPGQGQDPKYTEGVFRLPGDPNKLMVVSRGLGQPEWRIRINNRPELVLVQLTASKDQYFRRALEEENNDQ